MASVRVKKLYKRLVESTPEISIERAELYTEGVKAAAGKSIYLQRASGFARVLEQMSLVFNPYELIVGSMTEKERGAVVIPEYGWKWIEKELDFFSTRKADPLKISEAEKQSLKDIFHFWEGKSVEESVDQKLSSEMKNAMEAGLTTLGGHATSIGNITPDYEMVLKEGFEGIKSKVEKQLQGLSFNSFEDGEKAQFYEAAIVALDAAVRFADRLSKQAADMAENEENPIRKNELADIARICSQVPNHPPKTFYEALHALWITHLIISMETNPHGLLFGRLDQYLWPFYKKDMKEGRITKERAKELLCCFWIKVTELIKIRDNFYSEAFSGFPLFQVAMIGGVDENGHDVTNDLSYLILDVVETVKTTQPSISLRCHQRTPAKLLISACKTVKTGLGIPAFVNDDTIIPKMILRGASLKEARTYVTNCIEPDIPGMTDSRSHSGYVNFGKCMELTLNNGVDPATGRQIGPKTGPVTDFKTFEGLYQAVFQQIRYAIELIEKAYNMCETVHAQLAPEVFLSLFIHDCIKRGKPRQSGGARYNHSTIFGTGAATLVDSLLAIEHLVYNEKSISLEAFAGILQNNFQGEERFRMQLLNRCPKFGNDIEEADLLAHRVISDFCEEIQNRKGMRDGTYIAEIHSVAMHTIFGKLCGATPDGRKKGQVLSDGISPVQGADRKGPTATISSVEKLDHLNVLNGTLFNQKLSPQCLKTENDFSRMASLIKTYFAGGGHHIQFNIVDTETLLAAQANPEQYKSLVVRVAGYSAFFNELTKEVQDEIIQRTEQTWG